MAALLKSDTLTKNTNLPNVELAVAIARRRLHLSKEARIKLFPMTIASNLPLKSTPKNPLPTLKILPPKGAPKNPLPTLKILPLSRTNF